MMRLEAFQRDNFLERLVKAVPGWLVTWMILKASNIRAWDFLKSGNRQIPCPNVS
jgi:hypothetical protein